MYCNATWRKVCVHECMAYTYNLGQHSQRGAKTWHYTTRGLRSKLFSVRENKSRKPLDNQAIYAPRSNPLNPIFRGSSILSRIWRALNAYGTSSTCLDNYKTIVWLYLTLASVALRYDWWQAVKRNHMKLNMHEHPTSQPWFWASIPPICGHCGLLNLMASS